jgi:hypothetical protein
MQEIEVCARTVMGRGSSDFLVWLRQSAILC